MAQISSCHNFNFGLSSHRCYEIVHQESFQERLEGSQRSHLKPKLLRLSSPWRHKFPRHVQNHTVTPLWPPTDPTANSIVHVNSTVYINSTICLNSVSTLNNHNQWLWYYCYWIDEWSRYTTRMKLRNKYHIGDTRIYMVRLLTYVYGRRCKKIFY